MTAKFNMKRNIYIYLMPILHELLNLPAMKIKLSLLGIILFTNLTLWGQTADNCVTQVILKAYSEKSYSSTPVTDQQLDQVLKCGIKAPSARNKQPWRFTVIRDEATMKDAIGNVVAGNVLIIVSGLEQGENTPDFDCGLTTESMFVAAHGLGLGARIYGSPAGNINSKRELFQIPSGYKAVVVLRIGNIDESADAVSGATTRNNAEEIVNYKK
jgi:nitroreductase